MSPRGMGSRDTGESRHRVIDVSGKIRARATVGSHRVEPRRTPRPPGIPTSASDSTITSTSRDAAPCVDLAIDLVVRLMTSRRVIERLHRRPTPVRPAPYAARAIDRRLRSRARHANLHRHAYTPCRSGTGRAVALSRQQDLVARPFDHLLGREIQGDVDHRDLDQLAFAGAIAVLERGQQCNDSMACPRSDRRNHRVRAEDRRRDPLPTRGPRVAPRSGANPPRSRQGPSSPNAGMRSMINRGFTLRSASYSRSRFAITAE